MCSRPGARKNTTAWRRKRSTRASALAWRLPRPPDAVAVRAERTVTRFVWPVSEPTTCWLSGRSRSTLLRAAYATSGAPLAAPQSASWAPYLARARSHSARRGGRQSSLARAPVGRRQQADALLHRCGDASAARLAQRVAAMRVSAFSERARACGCRTSVFLVERKPGATNASRHRRLRSSHVSNAPGSRDVAQSVALQGAVRGARCGSCCAERARTHISGCVERSCCQLRRQRCASNTRAALLLALAHRGCAQRAETWRAKTSARRSGHAPRLMLPQARRTEDCSRSPR